MDLLAWKAIDPALEWNRWPRNIMTGHGVATKASGIGLDARLVAEVVAATLARTVRERTQPCRNAVGT